MREMVESEHYRHVPTGRLAVLAQRIGKLYASATTWWRLIRERGWCRSRRRVYPAKPKVGIRATRPDELWHVDRTIIKLLDGTKLYLHAVIDNYSRRILAWCLSTKFDVLNTMKVLHDAAEQAVHAQSPPQVTTDSGTVNVNGEIDKLIGAGLLSRVLPLVDVTFSNSTIEAWWRSLKHQWFFLHTLDTEAAVQRLIAFYVRARNSEIPHHAFKGQTPDEMYFGIGGTVPERINAGKGRAREARHAANRAATCHYCRVDMHSDGDAASPIQGTMVTHNYLS